MDSSPPPIRVIVRLPFNRPEEADTIPEPPRIDWNEQKEKLLWEVIAKSQVPEGGGIDWKGLASHLQVPLTYLLYRAEGRYKDGLRGLRAPAPQPLSAKPGSPPAPASTGGECPPKIPAQDGVAFPRKDSLRDGTRPLTVFSVGRPLAIRTRLNSLGNVHRSMNSPQKVTSSSVITLQGPKRTYAPLRPLSPTSSRPSPSSPSSGAEGGDEREQAEEEEEEEDEMRKFEEEERHFEEQQALERKLEELRQKMTKDALGLISSPPQFNFTRRDADRVRMQPLSTSSVSSSLHQRLDMSRRYSQTPSHHSLSSTSSPQGSIPDIPSPPSESRSQPSSPIARHLSPPGPSRSPPAVSHGNALGTVRSPSVYRRPTIGGNVRSEKGSEIGSTASSISDMSDASLSSALGSSLMSTNLRGQSSRLSNPRKPNAR